jgi:hypothetical protein
MFNFDNKFSFDIFTIVIINSPNLYYSAIRNKL